jgi:hypothetical protein
MPAYTNLTVARLRQLCIEKNLSTDGLKKAQLIQLLKGADAVDQTATRTLEGMGDEGDEEEILNLPDNGEEEEGDDADEIEEVDEDDNGDGEPEVVVRPKLKESEHIKSLKLQIKLAQIQLEQHKMEAATNPSQGRMGGADHHPNVKGMLPTMGNGDDVLTFFHAWETTLQLHGVTKEIWGKLLPPCLNPKASKIYGRLSLEECRDYDVVKNAILETFRLTPKIYLEKL